MVKQKEKRLRLLFIGNSHTYYNDLPAIVVGKAVNDQICCDVTMIAHGGWFLEQHVQEPEVRFNILYGKYDYVILQEHSHPMESEEKYAAAVRTLCEWIRQAGATPVIYATWTKKEEPEKQEEMDKLNRIVAKENDALLAPVGENWWGYKRSWPELELYAADGQHASENGSIFAAKMIWETIRQDMSRKERQIRSH